VVLDNCIFNSIQGSVRERRGRGEEERGGVEERGGTEV